MERHSTEAKKGKYRNTVEQHSAEAAPPPLQVLLHIGSAMRSWKPGELRPVGELRFTYEQEAAPEEFFTPYLWLLTFETAGVSWDTSRVLLFPTDALAIAGAEDAEGAAPQRNGDLPVLGGVIDVVEQE